MKKRTKNQRMQADRKAEEATTSPGSATPTPEQIQRRAYEIYETRGCEAGHELDDWLLAEYELKAEIGRQGQSPAE